MRTEMHVKQLVELAGRVATHAPMLIRARTLVSESAARQYWTASRSRLGRWSNLINELVDQLRRGPNPVASRQLRATCEEILASEILTRVWAAVARLYDEHVDVPFVSPIAESVYRRHLEARNTVLHLIAGGQGLQTVDALSLNKTRRSCERWTDMLVGYLSGMGEVSDYVFDPERMRDFAEDLSYGQRITVGPAAEALLTASLKTILGDAVSAISPCADLNQQLGSAIVDSFPAGTLDAPGVESDPWHSRLIRATDDTQGMINAFLSDVNSPVASARPESQA